MGRTTRFISSEVKRHYKRKGPSESQKQWMAIEKMFTYAKECVKEREIELQKWDDAFERMEHIKEGGDPYAF